jgi:FkbM family methyltransferase
MLEEGLCTVTGFDPQSTKPSHPKVRQLPYVIGNGQSATLNTCVLPGMTSLLTGDWRNLALFPALSDWAEIKSRSTVETVRLDDVEEIEAIDFLKMDVQGSEIDVFRSGRVKLAKTVAIMTEVSFVTLYKGQPAFGDVDSELRRRGFIPHCFVEAKTWPIATKTKVPNADPHQLLEADLLYVADYSRPMAAEQWKHLAMIAHHVCGSFDLAMFAIERLVEMEAIALSATDQYRKILEAL